MDHTNHTKTPINNQGSNPCTDKLTDMDYLKHMIPHHQVAIDMSNLLIKSSRNPMMIHICGDITRKQDYEIWEMKMMMKKFDTMFDNTKSQVENIKTKLDKWAPKSSKSKDGSCNPLFFKPNDHAKMMKDMKLTDKSYLEHMIPHHQVAIEMSRRLLMHTNHSYLLYFCRKLIIDQQGEIYTMNNLLKNSYNNDSDLFQ